MRIVLLQSGKSADIEDSYAARLIEQGRAVIAPCTAKNMKEEPEPVDEKPKGKKIVKG